jgi:hypothetical protein
LNHPIASIFFSLIQQDSSEAGECSRNHFLLDQPDACDEKLIDQAVSEKSATMRDSQYPSSYEMD